MRFRDRTVVTVPAIVLVVTVLTTVAVATPARRHNGTADPQRRTAARVASADVEMGRWLPFEWNGGDGAVGPTLTFRSQTAVLVTITDAFCPGDVFTLSDRGTLIGATSEPERSTCRYQASTSNPRKALEDDSYTHGLFVVPSGRHVLEIVASTSPFDGGAAYLRFDPMTKGMCKASRWRIFGGDAAQFPNQGRCVSLVASSGG